MQILILSGSNNSYFILSKEKIQEIPTEILDEIPNNNEKLFNGDIELLYSQGVHPKVDQIKKETSKTELLTNLIDKGFLKVVL
ncbi:MAG: hypothetical protein J7514_03620 [Acinetobacter oleivorans]|nr:hypothetical protein [Acinetobacter oleivorans]